MCSLEHLWVVAMPTTGCFQHVCHLTYIFCSIGVLQLVAATMCVLSAMFTPLCSCFSVLCWYATMGACGLMSPWTVCHSILYGFLLWVRVD